MQNRQCARLGMLSQRVELCTLRGQLCKLSSCQPAGDGLAAVMPVFNA